MEQASAFTTTPRGCLLNVWVIPGTSHTQFSGLFDGMLRIRINKPAGEDPANKELISFLRRCFSVKPELVSGKTSRHKVLLLPSLSYKKATERLQNHLVT